MMQFLQILTTRSNVSAVSAATDKVNRAFNDYKTAGGGAATRDMLQSSFNRWTQSVWAAVARPEHNQDVPNLLNSVTQVTLALKKLIDAELNREPRSGKTSNLPFLYTMAFHDRAKEFESVFRQAQTLVAKY